MKASIKAYCDRSPLSSLPEETSVIVKRKGLYKAGENTVSFCGAIISQESVHLFFPRSSDLGGVDLPASTRLLTKTLLKYHHSFDRGILSDDYVESVEEGETLSLVFNILEDFRHNGLYSRRKVFQTKNMGKIDWRRTMALEKPFFQESGTPIFLDYRGSKRRYESDCEIAKIHAKIVIDLIFQYGLLFDQLAPPSVDVSGINLTNKEYCSAKLLAELRDAYSDSDIRLLKMLKAYIDLDAGGGDSDHVFGLTSFHTVWEHMLSETLLHTVNLKDELPIPVYVRSADETIIDAPQKSGRTDVILKSPRTDYYCVVDAKYYDAITVTSSPGWKDLVKQFFYAKAIKDVFPSSDVSNAFIFPGLLDHWASSHMKHRNSDELMDDKYVPIKCFYVDPMEVMESFVRGAKLKDLSELLLQ